MPGEVSDLFSKTTERRVVATLDGKHRYHCALMPIIEGGFFMNVNKATRDKLKIEVGQAVIIRMGPDVSPYGMPVSSEFEEVLRQDPFSAKMFHALTPVKQRSLIYYVDNVKNPEIKLRRAFVIMEHLALHGGKVDHKELNEEMKAANKKAKLR